MAKVTIQSGAEQVAAHVRAELERGRWAAGMPGRSRLAAELGVSGKLVEAALGQLEREGLLAGAGPRRRRRVVTARLGSAGGLRLVILPFESRDRKEEDIVDLRHRLEDAGHSVDFAERSLTEMRMSMPRVARLAEGCAADAFVVIAGSREILEWFARGPRPAFALFGRRRGVAIAGAGPNKPPAIAAATRRLLELGHRRIVMLARRVRRLPKPGTSETTFLAELAAGGIEPGPYHLPDWDDSVDGLHNCLEALFQVTPPTALIIQEVSPFMASYLHLTQRGLRVPQDVSLICTDAAGAFDWCRPPIAHIRWDSAPVLRRVLSWAENIRRGKEDRRQTLTQAEFVEQGTVGVRLKCGKAEKRKS